MDGGPFRVPRPADRRVTDRAESTTHRQPEEPQPVSVEPEKTTTARRATPSHRAVQERRSVKRFALPIIVGLILIIGVLGWFGWSQARNSSTAIDTSKYQAVFFTNGQVYFGKLHAFNAQYLQLTDIYYLQTQTAQAADSENPQQTSTDQSNVQLVKLGDEIHGPEDKMIISKDQVLFYENLKTDGKVAQSIAQYKQSN